MSRRNNPPSRQEGPKRKKITTLIVFILVFTLAWLPLLLSVTGVGQADTLPYSIYNPNWDGCTKLRSYLEQTEVEISGTPTRLKVQPLISSLSVVNGFPYNTVLLVLGPSMDFDIIETSSLIAFFSQGGCLVIADDFGTGNRILDNLAVLLPSFPSQDWQFTKISVVRFDTRLLLDADQNAEGKPLLPVITSFNDGGEIFHETHTVIMNYATGITGSAANVTTLAQSSTNSWLTIDWEHPEYNPNRPGLPDTPGPFSLMSLIHIDKGLIVLISDASIFINDMIDRADNRLFAVELFSYLAKWANADTIIVDHNHLSWPPWTPVLYFGLILGQITYLSANWLLAPLAPLLVLWMVRGYLPFGRPRKETPREIYRLRGQTLFTKTIYEYVQGQRYNDALRIIYGRLKRDLTVKYGLRVFDVPRLLAAVTRTRQPPELRLLSEDLEELERAVRDRRLDREKFLELFFKVKRIRELIG